MFVRHVADSDVVLIQHLFLLMFSIQPNPSTSVTTYEGE